MNVDELTWTKLRNYMQCVRLRGRSTVTFPLHPPQEIDNREQERKNLISVDINEASIK